MAGLLSIADLPEGFVYPPSFIRIIELGLTDLEPWEILVGDRLRRRLRGLTDRFPNRHLVPFAGRQDNDDVACWDIDQSFGRVVVIHDFTNPGWENRAEYTDFYAWLRRAIDDLIEFE